MEKNTRKIVIQKHLLLALIMVVIVASALSRSYGAEGRNLRYGFSVFGGTGDAWHNETDMTVYGFLPCVDLALHRNWDLEFEGNYSYWNIARECDLYFLGVDANILFKPIQRNWGSLFLLAGGGLGYDSAGKRLKRDSSYLVGDQHLGGILQGGAGFYYNLGKGLALRAEYRFYHISEPFRKDIGLNTHTALLGISF
jgi:opacity protein-like surface antigen